MKSEIAEGENPSNKHYFKDNEIPQCVYRATILTNDQVKQLMALCDAGSDESKKRIIVPSILTAYTSLKIAQVFTNTDFCESSSTFTKVIFKISLDKIGTIIQNNEHIAKSQFMLTSCMVLNDCYSMKPSEGQVFFLLPQFVVTGYE